MSVAIVSGSAGLVGASAVGYFASQGLDVIGVDNDMRKYFFGPEASTRWNAELLERSVKNYRHVDGDIRDRDTIDAWFRKFGKEIALIVHAAAQPSHDWAAREPHTDFAINAIGTINLLEATRRHSPEATFIFMSTNKVYGDTPNRLPLVELDTRWELSPQHPYAADGIDESMSVDQCLHSPFGASKLAADVLVQEYGRYFGMRTACFRGSCLTGPVPFGAELHGFLAYLVKCAVTHTPYSVVGYKGKQVRDNLHVTDLVAAIWEFFRSPRCGAVYNIGGGRFANCSVMEAVRATEHILGRSMCLSYTDTARVGDHIWWISNTNKFRMDYPAWQPKRGVHDIIEEIAEALVSRSQHANAPIGTRASL
jgi:CDP-paratose 2-epimerase